jgi:hypothetical protein
MNGLPRDWMLGVKYAPFRFEEYDKKFKIKS